LGVQGVYRMSLQKLYRVLVLSILVWCIRSLEEIFFSFGVIVGLASPFASSAFLLDIQAFFFFFFFATGPRHCASSSPGVWAACLVPFSITFFCMIHLWLSPPVANTPPALMSCPLFWPRSVHSVISSRLFHFFTFLNWPSLFPPIHV